MTPEVALIGWPAFDFATFLSVANRGAGYPVAQAADACPRVITDAERFSSCLAALTDKRAAVGLAPAHFGLFHYTVLLAADDDDVVAILEAAGMPFASAAYRGATLAVVSGSLAQWRDAVKIGTAAGGNVRACFNKVLSQFDKHGLTAAWRDFERKPTPDGLVRLELKK